MQRFFDLELIRLCKYLLKFGLFGHRSGQIDIGEIRKLFAFLSYLLDKFTFKAFVTHRKILDKIIAKDTVLEGGSNRNPVRKAVNDLKYRMLNKNDWQDVAGPSGQNFVSSKQQQQQFQIQNIHVSCRSANCYSIRATSSSRSWTSSTSCSIYARTS